MHIVYLPCPVLPSLSCTCLARGTCLSHFPRQGSRLAIVGYMAATLGGHEGAVKVQVKAQLQVHSGMVLAFYEGLLPRETEHLPGFPTRTGRETHDHAGWPPVWPFARATAVLPECQNLVP